MELLPFEVFVHFELEFEDARSLALVNKLFYDLLPFNIKITEQIVYKPSYKHFLPDFTNIKLENNTLCYLNLFTKVHTLNLSRTKVTDVSALGRVHTLDLSYTEVTNVSALGRVHTLDLTRTNVSDVSALGGVNTLDLRHTKVTDVSALGGVRTLYLSGANVSDMSGVSALDKVFKR